MKPSVKPVIACVMLAVCLTLFGCGGGGGGGQSTPAPGSSSSRSSESSASSSSVSSASLPLGIMDVDSSLMLTNDYLIDSKRDLLYVTHKNNSALSAIDLKTGAVVKSVNFEYSPEKMTLSPDGNKLFVALLTHEHSPYRWDEDQSGFIAVVDLNTLLVSQIFAVNIDPFDLVVTSNNKLIVSSGSGQWTKIVAYNATTGAELASANVREGSMLALHPIQNWVFVAPTESGHSIFDRFDVSGAGIVSSGSSPYNGDHRINGGLWATPDGLHLISRGGDLFLASNMTFVKRITASDIFIKKISFDPKNQLAILGLSNGEILIYNLTSVEEISKLSVFGEILHSGVSGDYLYSLVSAGSLLSLVRDAHPCPGCATNTSPVAAFSYAPLSGDTASNYVFDASLSSDADGHPLTYRWDVDVDGVWDTEFSANPVFNKKFMIAGTKFVRLQVKDSLGYTHTHTRSFVVAQGIDSGTPVAGGSAFQYPFAVTAVISDVPRARQYVTDKAAKRLYSVNLSTGLTEKYFQFDYMPERMTLSPDGNKLYVALLTREHNSYAFDVQSGFIAVLDLGTQTLEKIFAIDLDPYDLVVTAANKLIVSSGSGQWTAIKAYNAATGAVLGSASIRQASRLALHPSQNWVFAADTDLSPADIEKFDISGVGIVALGDSPYHGDYRMGGNVWATPDGNYLITRGGDVFNASDMTYVASLTEVGVSIEALTFDPNAQVALLALSSNHLETFNLKSFLSIAKVATAGTVKDITVFNGEVYLTRIQQSNASVQQIAHPCPGCASNQAPVASFNVSPVAGDTTANYIFDASASADPELEQLSFRWDLETDGKWDTDFSTNAVLNHRFTVPGFKTITLQARDAKGLVDTVTQNFNVLQGIDYGVSVTESEAYELGFTLTEAITDFARNKMYVSDKTGKRLYVVDLASGLTERYFEFAQMPERMSLSPDGVTLAVALLKHEHSHYRWAEDQGGFIALMDLNDQAFVKTFSVSIDPYDLVLTDSGKLVVTSGSGQWTNIHAYDSITGADLGSASIRQLSRLALHPSQNVVFATGTDTSSSDIHRFDISGTGITALSSSPYRNANRGGGRVWVSPDGYYVITRGGDVFLASNLTYVSSITATGVSINALLFDNEAQVLMLALTNNTLESFNPSSLLSIGKLTTSGEVRAISVVGGNVYLATVAQASAKLVQFAHPCPQCNQNRAPNAQLSINPSVGNTTSNYVFNAAASSDPDGDLLSYRWDIDGDGIWESDFSTNAVFNYRFILAGSKTVKVQVRDSKGAIDSVTRSFTVAQGIDYGQAVSGSTPNQFAFTATQAVVDVARKKMYISDKVGKRLYVIDMISGLTEKYFEFAQMPERMAISPDGSKLVLALLVQEHSYYWWAEDQSGFIAVVDLDTKSLVNTFAVDIDPYDLVLTNNNKLVVSSGSGQWTFIKAYDAANGTELGRASIRQASRLSLHPTQNWVFAADTDSSPSDIEKFDISGPGIVVLGDSPYHGDHRMYGNVWVVPDGSSLITRGGDVFSAANMTFVKSLTAMGVSIQSVAFSGTTNTAVLLTSAGSVIEYNLDTLTERLVLETGRTAAKDIFLLGSSAYVLEQSGIQYSLYKINLAD